MRLLLPLILILHLTLISSAQDGTIDRSFNPNDNGYFNGDGANGAVNSTTVLSNGKIIIGGEFQYYNGSSQLRLVRLFADGRLDTSFNKGGVGLDGTAVNAVKELPDGRLLIAGDFSKYNNVSRRMIARLNSDGSLDTSFNNNVQISGSAINSIAVQPNGKIIIAGDFILGGKQGWIARLLPNGQPDTSFHSGPGPWGYTMAVGLQSTGKIIVGGTFASDSFPKKYFCRFDSTGRLDTSFHTGIGPNDYVSTLLVLPDDRIIIGGKFSTFNGGLRRGVTRLLPDGSLDAGFAPNLPLTQPVLALSLNNSGKLLLGGLFNGIYRLNADGSRDSLFNLNAAVNGYVTAGPLGSKFNAVYSLSLQPDGKYIVGGEFNLYGVATSNQVLRITEEGFRDTSFNRGRGANHGIYALKVQGDGKILIAGTFTAFNDTTVNGITRLQPDGTIDTTFNKNGTGFKDEAAVNGIYSMELQPDGKILIGGDFLRFNGSSVQNIARLLPNGYVDNSFLIGSGPEGFIFALAAQPDEKIMVGGSFKIFNGKYNSGIVRLNPDGSVDPSFTSKFGTDFFEVNHITIQPDGKYLVSGNFQTYAGTNHQYIVRLLPNGDLDPSFTGIGTNNVIEGTVLQPDGKILVSGKFDKYNNTSVSGFIRLKPDGSFDSSFIVGKPGKFYSSSCILPDGKIIVGSYGPSATDTATLIRLHPNGDVDTSFARNAGWKSGNNIDYGGSITILFDSPGLNPVVQAQGKILVYGYFWSYDGVGRNRLALINNQTTPYLSIGSVTPVSICAGGSVNIPFNSIALAPGTVITAQLSDSTGNFSNPLVIGTSTGLSSGLLIGTIPPNVPAGSAYRIRLVSGQPAMLSSANGTNIKINAFAANPTWIGAYSSSWNDVRNWCGGIPSATTDVTIPSGTPFNTIVSFNALARNITVNAGATLGMDASSFLNLYGNITNNGTLATDNGQIQFRGAAKQNISAMTIARIVLNGIGGVALNGNLSVTQSLTFTQGHITLGAYDLTLKGINFGSKGSHIITNGAGAATSGDGASSTIAFFPIGADSVSYNPITINGTDGKNFLAKVSNNLPATVVNPSKAVNRTWHVVPTGTLSFPANVDVQFADAEGNPSYSSTNPFEAGINNNNSWKIIASGVTLSGTTTSRHVALNTSDFGDIVIGNQGTIQTPLAVSSVNTDSTYAEMIPTLVTSSEVKLKLNVRRAALMNWTIMTSTGKIVYQFSKKAIAGESLISVNLPNLASGVYQLVGRSSSGNILGIRFIKL